MAEQRRFKSYEKRETLVAMLRVLFILLVITPLRIHAAVNGRL